MFVSPANSAWVHLKCTVQAEKSTKSAKKKKKQKTQNAQNANAGNTIKLPLNFKKIYGWENHMNSTIPLTKSTLDIFLLLA